MLGHALSYLLAMPDPHHRDLALRSTGHENLPTAPEAVLILLLAGVAALIVRAWTGASRTAAPGLGTLAGTLVTAQVGAFVGQEVAERLIAGAPLGDLVHQHVLTIGIVVQVVVAILGAVVLRWLTRQAERLASASALRRPGLPRPTATTQLAATSGRSRDRVLGSAHSVRAPPAPHASPAI